MRVPRRRFTVRRLMVVVAVCALVCLIAVWVVDEREKTRMRNAYYPGPYARFSDSLRVLGGRVPRGVDRRAWENAVDRVYALSYNTDLADSARGFREMEAVGGELEKKLGGTTGPETLEWLWGRLARTGESGRRYARNHGDEFQHAVRACARSLSQRPVDP